MHSEICGSPEDHQPLGRRWTGLRLNDTTPASCRKSKALKTHKGIRGDPSALETKMSLHTLPGRKPGARFRKATTVDLHLRRKTKNRVRSICHPNHCRALLPLASSDNGTRHCFGPGSRSQIELAQAKTLPSRSLPGLRHAQKS